MIGHARVVCVLAALFLSNSQTHIHCHANAQMAAAATVPDHTRLAPPPTLLRTERDGAHLSFKGVATFLTMIYDRQHTRRRRRRRSLYRTYKPNLNPCMMVYSVPALHCRRYCTQYDVITYNTLPMLGDMWKLKRSDRDLDCVGFLLMRRQNENG